MNELGSFMVFKLPALLSYSFLLCSSREGVFAIFQFLIGLTSKGSLSFYLSSNDNLFYKHFFVLTFLSYTGGVSITVIPDISIESVPGGKFLSALTYRIVRLPYSTSKMQELYNYLLTI